MFKAGERRHINFQRFPRPLKPLKVYFRHLMEMKTGDPSSAARKLRLAPRKVSVFMATASKAESPHEVSKTTEGKKSPSKKRAFNTVSFSGGCLVSASARVAAGSGKSCGRRELSSSSQSGYSDAGMPTRGSAGETGMGSKLHNLRKRSCSLSVGVGRGAEAVR